MLAESGAMCANIEIDACVIPEHAT